jgi:acetoacetyl-CoA reductase
MKSLAHEGVRNGITSNAICPGYISTDMVATMPEKAIEATISELPTGRLGEPKEIARCVLFLASEGSSFINGSIISANGAQFFV